MKIVVVNAWDDHNRGSCALTCAALELLRRAFPESQVTVVPPTMPRPPDFRHTRARYPDVAIAMPPLQGDEGSEFSRAVRGVRQVLGGHPATGEKWLEAVRAADLVVVRGGISLHNWGTTLRSDWQFVVRMLPLLAAVVARKPVVLLGAQVGPFRTTISQLFSRQLLQRVHAVARDRVSLSELSLPEDRALLAPDTAFALSFDIEPKPPEPTLALVISAALREGDDSESHVQAFAAAANATLHAELVQRILVVVQSTIDLDMSRRLAARLGAPVIDDDLSPAQLVALYGRCRLVVTSRLHGFILSALAGTPAVLWATELTFKERAVLDQLGLNDLRVSPTDRAHRLTEACLSTARDRDRAALRIAAVASGARDELLRTVPAFLQRAARRGAPLN